MTHWFMADETAISQALTPHGSPDSSDYVRHGLMGVRETVDIGNESVVPYYYMYHAMIRRNRVTTVRRVYRRAMEGSADAIALKKPTHVHRSGLGREGRLFFKTTRDLRSFDTKDWKRRRTRRTKGRKRRRRTTGTGAKRKQ